MNTNQHTDCGCIFTPARAEKLSTPAIVISWICRVSAAVILLQTLFFKFTGAEESIYIFTKVGLEPWGRYGSGIVELIASILLLTPRYAWAGALLALGVISGAIISHLTVLGIVVKDDGGLLFGLAIIVFITSAITIALHRRQIPWVSGYLQSRSARP
jgi:putative oxidoreductase